MGHPVQVIRVQALKSNKYRRIRVTFEYLNFEDISQYKLRSNPETSSHGFRGHDLITQK